MKYSISKTLLLTSLAVLLFACDKKDTLATYNSGTAPTLTASTTAIAPAASDSNTVALTLSWTNPGHATDSATYKYTIEIDTTGKNFASEVTKVVTGTRSTSFLAKELNNILLARNYAFNVPVDMDVRVTSSYANNNERLSSNVIKIRMTPYKVPPKVTLPINSRLFITGDAAPSGWVNPVPLPSQEFARLDETTWAGIFQLTGGKQYLLLPVNGDWSKKYALQDNTVAGIAAGGNFGYHVDGQAAPDVYTQNFNGPATSGLYKIVVDFQFGKFTVTPYTSTLPTNLYITGDAAPSGWVNPVPTATQQFTRVNSSVWELTLSLTGGKQYLLLPSNGDWSKKYALKDNTITGAAAGGEFGYHQDGQASPDVFTQNFVGPATSGTYKISVNYAAPTTTANASGRYTVQ